MAPNLVFCCTSAPRTPLTAGVTDRQTDRRTDGRTDRHNKQALGPLVSNTLKLSSGYLIHCQRNDATSVLFASDGFCKWVFSPENHKVQLKSFPEDVNCTGGSCDYWYFNGKAFDERELSNPCLITEYHLATSTVSHHVTNHSRNIQGPMQTTILRPIGAGAVQTSKRYYEVVIGL